MLYFCGNFFFNIQRTDIELIPQSICNIQMMFLKFQNFQGSWFPEIWFEFWFPRRTTIPERVTWNGRNTKNLIEMFRSISQLPFSVLHFNKQNLKVGRYHSCSPPKKKILREEGIKKKGFSIKYRQDFAFKKTIVFYSNKLTSFFAPKNLLYEEGGTFTLYLIPILSVPMHGRKVFARAVNAVKLFMNTFSTTICNLKPQKYLLFSEVKLIVCKSENTWIHFNVMLTFFATL